MSDEARLAAVRQEFARQSGSFDAYAAKADVKVEARFQAAIGPAGQGRVLDVACGPGVVSVALSEAAEAVICLDATDEMLAKAQARAEKAGCGNLSFQVGDAENLPFQNAAFDAVVTRLSLHHFTDPGKAVREMHRVLKPGGRVVVVDVVADPDPALADLHNAIEILRDPTHIRMMPPAEIDGLIADAGFQPVTVETWDADRHFNEWMGIVNEATRAGPLRTVVRALAASGHDAGIGLKLDGDDIAFFHRWRLIAADKSTATPDNRA